MVRKHLKKSSKESTSFKMRGLDNTRIEALSDGVFALAIALLLISSEIPKTFDELRIFLKNFLPFAATISILTLVWYQHYVFFIRYGMKDAGIVALNTLLLFLVLFFVYPLKFLFQVLFDLFSGLVAGDQAALQHLFSEVILEKDAPTLMVIYGLGGALVFLTMALMYIIAYRKRKQLELTDIEIYDTKSNIYVNLFMAGIPVLSALVSLFNIGGGGGLTFTISGNIYMSYAIIMPIFGRFRHKRKEKIFNL